MKQIILLLILVSSNYFFQPREELNYYPLHIGDFWQYKGIQKDDIGRIKSQWIAYKKVIGDTILNDGKKYFIIQENKLPTPNFSTGYRFIRVDSISGNVYGIQVSPYKLLIDSLFAKEGDFVRRCYKLEIMKDTTVFGEQRKVRKIRPWCVSSTAYEGFDLIYDIGESYRYYDDIFITWVHYDCNLVYAKINGQEFGTYLNVENTQLPLSFELFQNYPNPFNPETTIKYSIPMSSVMVRQAHHDNGNITLDRQLAKLNTDDTSVMVRQAHHDNGDITFDRQLAKLNTDDTSVMVRQAHHDNSDITLDRQLAKLNTDDTSVMVRQAHHDNSDVIPSLSRDELHVSLKIYDILGREVATLVDEYQKPGTYNYQFSISNYQLCSGVYFYQLKAGDLIQSRKMILLK